MKRSTLFTVSLASLGGSLLTLVALIPAVADDGPGVQRGQRFSVQAVTQRGDLRKVDSCACCGVIFSDDFESGDTSAWSSGAAKEHGQESADASPSGHRFRLAHQVVAAPCGSQPGDHEQRAP